MPTALKPLFPPALRQQNLLQCPPVGRLSSPHTRKFWFYVHEWLLKPLSVWYCRLRGIPQQPSVYILPFGLLLKNAPRLREQEGLAMNLARAMGVPAPRFISFGEPPPHYPYAMPSMLMTRLPGIELDMIDDDAVNFELVRDDLVRILTCMRRFASPWGDAICGVDGGPVCGPMVPASPLPPCKDEAAFHQVLRKIGHFSNTAGRKNSIAAAEAFFSLPPHAVVFTHGDLNRHNIMVDANGHVCGIFDWEAAAWLPEYWEVSVTALLPKRPWGQFMSKRVASDIYEAEVTGYRAVFALTADSLSM
ncbi:hypothetical protein OH77DRAFT_905952 [Trametes cingulata]|nr:hypothetical protein OH77DRAFT_905952 [Trametes cingulata]